MSHTPKIWIRSMVCAALGIACLSPAVALAQGRDMGCSPTLANPCSGGAKGGGGAAPTYDYEAARRAQQAAQAELQRQAEAERIERERIAEEKRRKDAEFIRNRDATAGALKGTSGDAMLQLKGMADTSASNSRGSAFDTGGSGLKGLPADDGVARKIRSKPAPHSDTSVVDARNVPSGLPKGLDNAIATAYASAPPEVSARVRKGFQAVMLHDWKVAKAWFQDALNRDPGNAGLRRLVALAEFSQRPAPTAVADKPYTNEPIPPGANRKTYAETSLKVHSHEEWMKFLFPPAAAPSSTAKQLQAPQDSDLEFLFGPPPVSSTKSGKTR